MSDIFISYSSADRERAKTIAEALEEKGWSVWWDRKIPAGKFFAKVIKEALDEAKCILVLWSKDSVKSDWVQIEAAEGARRKILVPAFIEDVEIPFEFSRIQAANLIDWTPSTPNDEFNEFINSIVELIGMPEPKKIEQKPLSDRDNLPIQKDNLSTISKPQYYQTNKEDKTPRIDQSSKKLKVFIGSIIFLLVVAVLFISYDFVTALLGWSDTSKKLYILKGHTDIVDSAQFSPDGSRIVTASTDDTARIWDSATGKELHTLGGHEDIVWSAAFSPDGSRIVTASSDNTARIWPANYQE